MKRFFQSLQAKYMTIILVALFLFQAAYLLIAMLAMGLQEDISGEKSKNESDPNHIEEKWHADAKKLERASQEAILSHFSKWKKKYPDASMFWVDEHGNLMEQLDVKGDLPANWTPAFTAKFIKERYGGDPFTVISFIGGDEKNGFIVLEIPRNLFLPPIVEVTEKYGLLLGAGLLLIITLFIIVSFLFFRGIRKRLLHLQEAMERRDMDNLPIGIDVQKNDEIGQLEQTFNEMILELKESKQREQEEEQLRRELIANLSHDLRTPLTKINAQTYSIAKEKLSSEGKQAVKALETSIVNIDRLIENLMSYTLLMASKHKQELTELDAVRFVRESMASWYPVFEKESFEVIIELEPFQEKWQADPVWLSRIFDNILQNVLRHAKDGLYLEVATESTDEYDAIVFIDHGKGLKNSSNEKGAGIGLSIVDMMVKGMKLEWDIDSGDEGTSIKILRKH
ncbi:sensor histidine kinase [Cytobacillus oceanisediminis]|uniref:histidine kinase n=1 Tax=Cytobacillus oceanisediminis 2691 TaxID=1196031 RepID=A0A160M6K1_9BACI|nr:HAMP domain-containing sensor histidine kinase [Cytobacillus oceanisediminis]AND38086.1 two-component sensor histidine kinase [Cytobacillus oceanisediminis 2691]MCM3245089.1 HAMP domain-containing histidine kinase [Cytobacillus oceanisediminis]MCS0825295.1 HAMP domain-containing histidine kinase [Cytobacillus firmus]